MPSPSPPLGFHWIGYWPLDILSISSSFQPSLLRVKHELGELICARCVLEEYFKSQGNVRRPDIWGPRQIYGVLWQCSKGHRKPRAPWWVHVCIWQTKEQECGSGQTGKEKQWDLGKPGIISIDSKLDGVRDTCPVIWKKRREERSLDNNHEQKTLE